MPRLKIVQTSASLCFPICHAISPCKTCFTMAAFPLPVLLKPLSIRWKNKMNEWVFEKAGLQRPAFFVLFQCYYYGALKKLLQVLLHNKNQAVLVRYFMRRGNSSSTVKMSSMLMAVVAT